MKVGSGILTIAADTKHLCLAWRSQEVKEGDCWGTIGGMVKEGMTPKEGALLEMHEEVGYTGPITLHPAYVFRRNNFEYHNFIGITSHEFGFHPLPKYAFETDFIQWMPYERILMLMHQHPLDFHRGLVTLFHESKAQIESYL